MILLPLKYQSNIFILFILLVFNFIFFISQIDWKGCGFINWDDVCSYFILGIKDEKFLEKQIPFLGHPNIVRFSTLKVFRNLL